MTLLANPDRLAADVVAEVMQPPPRVDYLAFAKDHITFSKEASPQFAGDYNERNFPFFSEILNALGPDDPCRIVSLAKSAQVGGTITANIFALGTMHMDPGYFMYVLPTTDNAIRWSRMKLRPMLRETECLADLFPEKSRDGQNSILYKERVDGRGAFLITGANSPASLSMVTIERQVQDDLAKWVIDPKAGDPETMADSRSKAIDWAKIFKISTPLIVPGCKISKNFEEGSQERYHVPCPHCGELQPLEWENMRDNIDAEKPEAACFSCVACGCDIEEHHRAQIVIPEHLGGRAKWVAKYPERRRHHRSFHLWAAYAPLERWELIARSWLKVLAGAPTGSGDKTPEARAAEQVFLNDTAGVAMELGEAAVGWETLRDRADATGHRRGIIPTGALLLTLGIDVQGDRVEWQLVGWGRARRRWVVDVGVIDGVTSAAGQGEANTGFISEPQMQAALDRLVKRTWPDDLGNRRGADRTAIDGNAYTEDVWSWVRRHPAGRVVMVRGSNDERSPLVARVKRQRNDRGKLLRYASRFYNFNASALKNSLFAYLTKDNPESAGYIAIPAGMGDEYHKQLTSERRVPRRVAGGTVWRWEKQDGVRNEALDTMNQAEVAAIQLGVRSMPDDEWDRLSDERETEPVSPQLDIEEPRMHAPAESTVSDDRIRRERARAALARARGGT